MHVNTSVTVAVVLLFYVHSINSYGRHVNPIALRKAKIVYNFGLSECNRVNLTILFLDRLRPPKQLTSTSCTYFC